MLENVNYAETEVLAEGENSDMITIPRTEYNRLVFERDEYRNISLELASRIPNLQKVQANIEEILQDGGVIE